MKKINIILMVFALAIMMSQCKKNEEQPTANDNVVTITLNLSNNNGSKVNVNPATGTVDFESGDKIYVGSGGKYVGFLTHNGTNFSGNITNPTEDQPLQLYFLGNVTPQETLSAGTSEECSVIISDQTEHLPVISCAASNENYISGVTAYSAHLLNKCALVKFNVTTPSNSPICITGMRNKVTVDFANNTMTPSQDGEGVIMLPAGRGENVEKWAILLPQEAVEEESVYSEDGWYVGICFVPEIVENGYLTNGLSLLVNSTTFPEGAIKGLFSVSNTQQVFFSKGNLQYQASTHIWRFAENQRDYVGTQTPDYAGNVGGTVTGSDNSNISSSYSGWIDLFGWGTSDNPTNTSTNNCDYSTFIDWGNNPIINGGNIANQWRTLTMQEWEYDFDIRYTVSGIRYAKAWVKNVKGVILLPDNWNNSIYYLHNANTWNTSFDSNMISASEWTTLEDAGAVFLPAAGYRIGTSVYEVRNIGFYWSASYYDVDYAYDVDIFNYSLNPTDYNSRHIGQSVRLVYNAE